MGRLDEAISFLSVLTRCYLSPNDCSEPFYSMFVRQKMKRTEKTPDNTLIPSFRESGDAAVVLMYIYVFMYLSETEERERESDSE